MARGFAASTSQGENPVLMWHMVCKTAWQQFPSGHVAEPSWLWGSPSVPEAQTPVLP